MGRFFNCRRCHCRSTRSRASVCTGGSASVGTGVGTGGSAGSGVGDVCCLGGTGGIGRCRAFGDGCLVGGSADFGATW